MALFGALLRAYRTERGLSQNQLAQKAGLTYSAISRLESGNRLPKRKTVENLAKALELGPEEAEEFFKWAGYVREREAVVL
jgi:transcriptional regulator with XRE-family HTH domain